jgi:nicotinate-nucleotide adenylyltransferase
MDVALFGGSFDPPHSGHESIIQEALKILNIDKLFVVPTYLNPFKNSYFLPPRDRYKIMKKLTAHLDRVEVLDIESKQDVKRPSIWTVEYLKSKYNLDRIYLIIGADNLSRLNQWYRFDDLNEIVTFVVATRNGIEIPNKFITLNIAENISSTRVRREILIDNIVKILDEKKAEDIEVFDMRDKGYIVDDVIIATMLNSKHGDSLVDVLKSQLKSSYMRVEESEDWIVIDLVDILIHIMTKEYRAKYNLEEFLTHIDAL